MMPSSVATSLSLQVLGLHVHVGCADAAAAAALHANLGAMIAPTGGADYDLPEYDLRYRIDRDEATSSYALRRDDNELQPCADLGELVFALEKDLTIELQLRRSELLFLHAAAMEWQGRALLLAGESGSGKSTMAWALLHHGFGYLSDELGPVDLNTMAVLPFPHALCLKREPPPPYTLPARTIRLGHRIHVPTESLPSPTTTGPYPLATAFLVKYRPELQSPQLRAIGRGEASARLYTTALNLLAHPNHGLDAAVRIAEQVPCFTLEAADLGSTCALIGAAMRRAVGGGVEAS